MGGDPASVNRHLETASSLVPVSEVTALELACCTLVLGPASNTLCRHTTSNWPFMAHLGVSRAEAVPREQVVETWAWTV